MAGEHDFAPLSEAAMAALAADNFEVVPNHDTYGPVRVELWDDNVRTFAEVKPADTLQAIAAELRASRAVMREWEEAKAAWERVMYTEAEQPAAVRLTKAEAAIRALVAHVGPRGAETEGR